MMTRANTATALLAALALLGGCSSNDDDDGGTGGQGPGPTVPAPSGDIFGIAGLGDADEPAQLDRTALEAQLGTLLGDGNSAEAIELEDDDTPLTALRRGQGGGGT